MPFSDNIRCMKSIKSAGFENKPEALGFYKHFYVCDISKIDERWPSTAL